MKVRWSLWVFAVLLVAEVGAEQGGNKGPQLPSFQDLVPITTVLSRPQGREDFVLSLDVKKSLRAPLFACSGSGEGLRNLRRELKDLIPLYRNNVKHALEGEELLKQVSSDFDNIEEELKWVLWGYHIPSLKQRNPAQKALKILVSYYWDKNQLALAYGYLKEFFRESDLSFLSPKTIELYLRVFREAKDPFCRPCYKALHPTADEAEMFSYCPYRVGSFDWATVLEKLYLERRFSEFISSLEVSDLETINSEWRGYACPLVSSIRSIFSEPEAGAGETFDDFLTVYLAAEFKNKTPQERSLENLKIKVLGKLLEVNEEKVRLSVFKEIKRRPNKVGLFASQLISMFRGNSQSLRDGIVDCLAQGEESVVPILVEALESGNLLVVQGVLKTLGAMGSKSSSAIPKIAPFLAHKTSQIRYLAASALGGIGKPSIPLLREILKEERNYSMRLAAMHAFQVMGEEGIEQLPLFIELLSDSDLDESAAEVIREFGPKAESAIGPLVVCFAGAHTGLQSKVGSALASIGDKAFEKVFQQLSSSDPNEKQEAALILGFMEVHPEVVVPALIEKISDRDIQLARNAIRALGKFGIKGSPAVPKLTEILSEKNEALALVAIDTLGLIGEKSDTAVSELEKWLHHSSTNFVGATSLALQRIAETSDAAIWALAGGLESPREFTRDQAEVRLAVDIRDRAKALFQKSLDHPDPELRKRATMGLKVLK